MIRFPSKPIVLLTKTAIFWKATCWRDKMAEQSVTISDDESELIVGSTKDEAIESFCKIPGVGRSKAELLYSAGFTTIEKLQAASVEELSKINGISPMLARSIINGAKKTDAKGEVVAKEETEHHDIIVETPKTNGARNELIDKYAEMFSISRDKAESIYFSGYTSFKQLKTASVDDLQKIYGIEKENALDIVEKMKQVTIKDEATNAIEVARDEEPPTVIGNILQKSKSIWDSIFGSKSEAKEEKHEEPSKTERIENEKEPERHADAQKSAPQKAVILEEADELDEGAGKNN